jgi:hypothetical protein
MIDAQLARRLVEEFRASERRDHVVASARGRVLLSRSPRALQRLALLHNDVAAGSQLRTDSVAAGSPTKPTAVA